MYLSRLIIKNYKSIDELDLTFRKGKNVIVGKNNSGKSNIIKAIDLILGENSPDYQKSTNVTENDFHGGSIDKTIFILVILSRDQDEVLNYEEINKCWGYHILGKVGGWKKEGGKNVPQDIIAERVRLNSISDFESIFEIDFEDSSNTAYINPKLKNQESFKDQLNDKFQFGYLFSAYYDSDKDCIIKDLRFLYRENDNTDWALASKARIRNELLQSAVIPAFRDPQNQLRANSYTWYGKLLQNYIDSTDSDLNKAFDEVKNASSKVFSKLGNAINDSKIKIAFPDTEVTIQFNPETKQDIYKSALIYVNDGFNSLLQEKGSGIQSSVIIGLFDFYVRNVSHVSSSLLAIEEPELYLHPHGRRVISGRLEDFLDGKKNQVIITTHSSEFITSTENDLHIILVKKNDGKTIAKSAFFEHPKDKRLLLKGQNTEMFFADHVILVEGGEKYVLEAASRYYGEQTENLDSDWINSKNISIISVSGKGEFLKYTLKLDELEIPWIVLADFDFIRDCLCEFLTARSENSEFIDKINSLKSEIIADISKSGGLSNYKTINDIPSIFHERIEELFNALQERNIFVFKGELENLYTEKSNNTCGGLTKEEKAICIASQVTKENANEFLDLDQITQAFRIFCEKNNLIK